MISIFILIAPFLLSLVNFFIAVPFLLAVILKNLQYLHQRVVSDIPGNPHAFDDCVISLFRTLPEPSNFNIVWTSINLTKGPYIIKGKKPCSRLSSLTIYNSGRMTDQPISIDIDDIPLLEDGEFEIILTRDESQQQSIDNAANKTILSCQSWSRCMIAMRNYVILPGSLVITPTISYYHERKVFRPSQTLVAGPASHQTVKKEQFVSCIIHIGMINLLAYFILRIIFGVTDLVAIVTLATGGTLSVIYRQACFQFGKTSLKKLTKPIVDAPHKFILPSAEASSAASQPSKLHRYWIMKFDITERSTIEHVKITGHINPSLQKYWSIVVYDEYGLPLPQYIYDDNIPSYAKSMSTRSDSNCDSYDYDIRLIDTRSNSSNPVNAAIIDLQGCLSGYVLFRLVHPTSNDVMNVSAPRAELIIDDKKSR